MDAVVLGAVNKKSADILADNLAKYNVLNAKGMKSVVFTANGNWTVPAGVTSVLVTAIAGGGGGGGCNLSSAGVWGGTGGVTSFGTLLSLIGGIGGQCKNINAGSGGASGTIPTVKLPLSVEMRAGEAEGYGGAGLSIYGKGGTGGTDGSGSQFGGGGASGMFVKSFPFIVTPTQVIPITVGYGGTGGTGAWVGNAGGAGVVLINYEQP